jgi:pimeloyl-ACP methyl ester carboxylesterase
MNCSNIRTCLDFIAAGGALCAAVAWYAAARHPVAKYAAVVLDESQTHLEPLNAKIQRGSHLNAVAATFAALSALAQGVSLLLPHVC